MTEETTLTSNLRTVLTEARDMCFSGKKPHGAFYWECDYCGGVNRRLEDVQHQGDCLVLRIDAVLSGDFPPAVETSVRKPHVDPDDPDDILIDFVNEYDQGAGATYEFDRATVLRMLRDALGGPVEETTINECQCGCYSGGCARPEGCQCDETCPCGGRTGPKPLLTDMADKLIRELHRRGMVTMQSVFDGAVLNIKPDPFTQNGKGDV